MEMALFVISILFNLWVIFLGGAEKIQDTLVGYFEFGIFADNPNYIRILAWFGLVVAVICIFM
jgi:hypothetical protein